MKKFTPEIKPKEGFGEIKFGENSDQITNILGEPEEVEIIEDDDDFNTTILNYWEEGLSAFFEGVDNAVLSCLETDIPDATLYGKRVFDLDEVQIITLMEEHGFEVAETEEEDGERRISYDDALIDFFFHEGELIAVNWGVLVNESGEIEEF
ncbi:MAG: hypothetical protein RQ761_09090 [Bacteroidales bacterium]|nr:hypothetical protein [Bacteroidales bacterium]